MSSYHPRPHSITDDKELRRCGRGIRRLVTLCGSVTQLLAEYDRRLLRPEPDDDGVDNTDDADEDIPPEKREEVRRLVLPTASLICSSHGWHPRRRDRDYQSYLEMVKLIPALKDQITNPHGGARMAYYMRVIAYQVNYEA